MGRLSELVSLAVSAVAVPFRLAGRAAGYLVALGLVAAAAAVVVAACTFGWLLVLSVVDLTVGVPLEPLGLVTVVGLPAAVNGVPLLYPVVLGVLTSVGLGWPSVGRETEFSPPITPP